jgi:hypothetical protein
MRAFDLETCSLKDYARMDTMMYETLMKEMKPSPMEVENGRMMEAVRWAVTACDAISRAGGSVTLLNDFPEKLVTTMIRNGINLQRELK